MTVSKAVAHINNEQFRAERLYQMSLFIAKTMLGKGIVSEDEYRQIDTILLGKYRPILGSLLAGKSYILF